MNRKLLLLATLLLAAATLHSQQAPRWWTGWLDEAGLALSLHLPPDGAPPQLYSPLQSADPLPLSSWQLTADSLTHTPQSLTLAAQSLRLKMQLHYDTATAAWQCSLRQGLVNSHLTLQPADTLFQLRRPQTPQPPYPFTEEPVTLQRTDRQGRTVTLSGTLTLPLGASKHQRAPAVLLVSGSGPQDRDETLFGHRPFYVLAAHLAAHGIATLRYDDRGVGQSAGPVDDATTLDLADDAEALFARLRRHPHIDSRRCGIAGHSEGAAIATLIAARNRRVAFAVMLAGQGSSGRDVLLQQNSALYSASGARSEAVAVRLRVLGRALDTLAHVGNANLAATLRTIVSDETQHSHLPQTALDSVGLGRGTPQLMALQLGTPWMRTFVALDPATWLPDVRCPLLALGGSRDLQVPPASNLPAISRLTRPGVATTHCLDGLNHLMQHCTTGATTEYARIEETFAPEALDLLTAWLQAVARRP